MADIARLTVQYTSAGYKEVVGEMDALTQKGREVETGMKKVGASGKDAAQAAVGIKEVGAAASDVAAEVARSNAAFDKWVQGIANANAFFDKTKEQIGELRIQIDGLNRVLQEDERQILRTSDALATVGKFLDTASTALSRYSGLVEALDALLANGTINSDKYAASLARVERAYLEESGQVAKAEAAFRALTAAQGQEAASAQAVKERAAQVAAAMREQAAAAEAASVKMADAARINQAANMLGGGSATSQSDLARMRADAEAAWPALDEVNKSSSRLSGTLGVMRHAIGGLAAFAVLGGIVEFVRSIGSANLEMQRMLNTLNASSGSMRVAQQEFQFLSQVADRLGTSLVDSGDAYARLAVSVRAAGLTTAQLHTSFIGLSEGFAATGRSGDEMNRFLVQLEQGLSQGTIQMRDLRAMAQSFPAAFELASEAAQRMGGTLQGFLKEGGLPARQFFLTFSDLLHERFASAAEQAATTLVGSVNRIGNALFELKSGSDVMEPLVDMMNQLADAIKSTEGQDALKGAVVAIVDLGRSMAPVLGAIIKNLGLIIDLFKAFVAVVVLNRAAAAVVTLSKVFKDLVVAVGVARLAVQAYGVSVEAVRASMTAFKAIEISTGIGALAVVLGTAAAAFLTLTSSTDTSRAAIDLLGVSAADATAKLNSMSLAQLMSQQQALTASVREADDALGSLRGRLLNLSAAVAGGNNGSVRAKQMNDLADAARNYADAVRAGGMSAADASTQFSQMLQAAQKGGAFTGAIAAQIGSAFEENAKKMGDAQELLKQIPGLESNAAKATDDMTSAVNAQNSALAGNNALDEYIQKLRETAEQAGMTSSQIAKMKAVQLGATPGEAQMASDTQQMGDLKTLYRRQLESGQGGSARQTEQQILAVARSLGSDVLSTPVQGGNSFGFNSGPTAVEVAAGLTKQQQDAAVEKARAAMADIRATLTMSARATRGGSSPAERPDALQPLLNAIDQLRAKYRDAMDAQNGVNVEQAKLNRLADEAVRKGKSQAETQALVNEGMKLYADTLGVVEAQQRKEATAANDAALANARLQASVISDNARLQGSQPIMSQRDFETAQQQLRVQQQYNQAVQQAMSQRNVSLAQENPNKGRIESDYKTALETAKILRDAGLDGIDGQLRKLSESQADILGGMSAAWKDYGDNAMNVAGKMHDAFGNFLQGFSDGLATMIMGGKFSFSDLANSFALELQKMATQTLVFLAGTALGFGKDDGFGSGQSGYGGIMSSLVSGFFGGGKAGGGPVSPNGVYEVTEDGPELLRTNGRSFLLMGNNSGSVVPNASGSSNKSTTIVNNITVQPTTTKKSAQQTATAVARAARESLARA